MGSLIVVHSHEKKAQAEGETNLRWQSSGTFMALLNDGTNQEICEMFAL